MAKKLQHINRRLTDEERQRLAKIREGALHDFPPKALGDARKIMDDEISASYEWHYLTRFPPKYLSAPRFISMLRDWIRESTAARDGFDIRLRRAALRALQADDVKLVRQALQCLAAVGLREDLEVISSLAGHEDENIARDARTCAFEIQQGNAGDKLAD